MTATAAEGDRRLDRVLHLLAPARDGGLERVVAMLAGGQGALRAHVAATIDPRDGKGEDHPFVVGLHAAGIPVTVLPVRGRAYLDEASRASRLAAELGATIVHTHGYRADLVARLMRRGAALSHVSTVHGFVGGRFRNRLNEQVQRYALRRADAVIAVSAPLVALLRSAGVAAVRIHCVINGFAPAPGVLPRAVARAALGIPPEALSVGWLGRLSPEKGVAVFVTAMARLPLPWRASVIGDGPDREMARALARKLGVGDRITFHGSIADAGKLLRAFDCYALTSHTEGTPIALLEALHAQVPVVATAVGGVPAVLGESAGLLVPPNDPPAVADAIAEVGRDRESAAARAERGRDILLDRFAPGRWVRAVDEVYRAARTASKNAGPR